MNGTTPSLHQLWRSGFVVEATTGALLRHHLFVEIKPRGDGNADAFTQGRSRRLVRWPWAAPEKGKL